MFKVIFDISVHFSANVTNTLPRSYPSKVYAVYRRNNKLVIVLVFVLALAVLANLLMMGLHMPVRSAPPFGLTGCFSADGMPPRFAFGVLPFLIYETILCFLMLWKVIQNYRDGSRSLFLSGMVHDSLIYFVGIFTVLCLDFTLYCLHKEEWVVFIIGREYTIPCAMGCRLLVNTLEWAEVSKSSHDTIATPITFYPIDWLPAHQSEVKITTVTPALDESYRFHTAIGQ
ncbi:hypothetical protein BU17DRAFT_71717 [Hysterangium stoloniferum]|nr:hypothetical protein BU17DRAFT_71717 [Hysterangium stoloniferum]